MSKIFLGFVVGVAVFSLSGCEMLKGAAKDVENTGSNVYDVLTGKTKL